MLTVKSLIKHLQALKQPDAPVFFTPENGVPIAVVGGIMVDHRGAPGGKVLNLAPTALDKVGGF